MDLVNTVWAILNERRIEEYSEIPNLLEQLDPPITNEPTIKIMKINISNSEKPYFAKKLIKETEELLRNAGYENPLTEKQESYEELKEKVRNIATRRETRYYCDIQDYLRKLGCPENDYDLHEIHINSLHKEPIFVEDTSRRILIILEKI